MKLSFILATAALALAACHSSDSPAPIIDSFSADIIPLPPGGTETLRFTVRNADKVIIDQNVGDVTGKTSVTVTPSVATDYTLTATNASHPAGVTQGLRVTLAVGPVISYFTATPSQVVSGTPVTYSWSVQNAATVSLDGTPVTGNSAVLNATATATHTLTVTGVPASTPPPPAKVVVRVVSAPSIDTFAASPATITQGSTSALSWSGSGLSYSLNDGTGDIDQGGQTHATVRPAATTTYTLTAHGPAGTTATKTQIVTVNAAGGARTLSYTDPLTLPLGAVLALKKNAASTPALIVLDVVAQQAVSANALAFNLPLDGSKVSLAASNAFTVNTSALNPGTSPAAAMASLRADGPLANILTLGIAQKPAGGGAVASDASIAAGTVLCTLRLAPATNAGPGTVFDNSAAYQVVLRGTASSSTKIALGTLTMN